MISILIPVYNYHIVDLVEQLHSEIKVLKMDMEIICMDDGSDQNYIDKNIDLDKKEQVSYILSNKRCGRAKTRQKLAKLSKHNWLIFVDADVIPKSSKFISNYLKYIEHGYDSIYGGFAYKKNPPEKEYLLRWTYGRKKEMVSALKRNEKPYKVIISANFLIRKKVFIKINSQLKDNFLYGTDNILGALLKSNSIKVFHIDNEVYHLGIDKSEDYIRKKEDSALNVLSLFKSNEIESHQNDLLRMFTALKQIGGNYVFTWIYKIFGNIIKSNLKSRYPSIRLMQLYRLSYICYLDKKK